MRHTPATPRLTALLAVGLLVTACQAAGASVPASTGESIDITVSHTAAGDALSGAGGLTLYVLTTDAGSSTCTTGACATTWPALKGTAAQVHAGSGISGTFGTTTWADGTSQITHNGQPLYYYVGDAAPGDANGQGTNGVWFIAPVGDQPTQGAATLGPSATPYRAPGY